jgi:hypothetical protein
MAIMKAKKNYRMKGLQPKEEVMQSLAEGGVVATLKNRDKKLDALEMQALTPKPAPVAPAKPIPVPAPAPVEAKVPPRKKFLGLFADGGYIDDYTSSVLPKMSSHRGQLAAYEAETQRAAQRGDPRMFGLRQLNQEQQYGLQRENQTQQYGLQQLEQNRQYELRKQALDLQEKAQKNAQAEAMQGRMADYYDAERKRDMEVSFFRNQPLVRTSVGTPVSAGKIPGYADGGLTGHKVYGEGGPTEDKVKIRVSPGEFVLPADTVKAVGTTGLRRLIADTHTPTKGGPGMNMGGKVWDWLTTWGTKAKAAAAAGADAWSEAEQEAAKPKATPKNSGRTPGWRSGTAPDSTAWTTSSGAQGPGGGTSTRPPPPTPPPGSGLGRVLPKQESAISGTLNRVLPVARSIPQLNRGVGLALAAAPYVGIAGSIGGGDHVPSPGGDTSDIPTVSPEFVNKTANLQAQPSTQPAVNNFGADRNPAERGLSNAPKDWPQPAPPQEGEGVVTSTGGRSLRTSSPGQLQFPSTAGRPSIDETNAAARAEMQAMDARTAEANAAEGRRLDEMNLRGQQAGAAWDRQVAIGRKDPAMYADAVRKEGLLKDEMTRTLTRDLKGMDEAGANTRAGMLAASAKYRDDQGLRGNVVQAQAQLAGHQLDNQRQLAIAMQGMRQKHGEAFDKFLDAAATTYTTDKEGKQIPDLVGAQAKKAEFMKYMYSPAVNNAKFLSQFGATSIDDLPKSQWAPLWESFQRRMALTKEAPTDSGDPPLQGPPTGIEISRLGMGDFFDSDSSRTTNAIGALQALKPGFLGTPESNLKATISTKGRKGHNVALDEYIANNPEKASDIADMVERTQGKEMADGIRKMYLRQR